MIDWFARKIDPGADYYVYFITGTSRQLSASEEAAFNQVLQLPPEITARQLALLPVEATPGNQVMKGADLMAYAADMGLSPLFDCDFEQTRKLTLVESVPNMQLRAAKSAANR